MVNENTMHLKVCLKPKDTHLNVGLCCNKMNLHFTNGGVTLTKWGTITGDIYSQKDLIQLINEHSLDDLILDCGTSTEVLHE